MTATRGEHVIITCQYPTQREDGTPLAQAEIAAIKLYVDCDAAGGLVFSFNSCTFDLPSEVFGQCNLAVTAVDTDDGESERSNVVQVFIKLPKPTRGGFR